MGSKFDALRAERLSIGDKVQTTAIKWNNSKKHAVIGFIGSRIFAVTLKPAARIGDVCLHTLLGVTKSFVGVTITAPISFTIYLVKGKGIESNWTVKQAVHHFAYAALYFADIFASIPVNAINPDIYKAKQNQRTGKKIDALRIVIQQSQKEIATKDTEIKGLNTRVNDLQTRNHQLHTAAQAAEALNTQAQQDIQSKNTELQTANQSLTTANQELTAITARANLLQAAVNQLHPQIQQQQQLMQAAEARLEQQVRVGEEALRALIADKDAEKNAALVQLREQLAREADMPNADLQAAHGVQLADLEARLNAQNAQALQELRQQHDGAQAALQVNLEAAQNELAQLQQQHAQLQVQHGQAQARIAELELNLQTLTTELDVAQQALAQATADLATAHAALRDKDNEIEQRIADAVWAAIARAQATHDEAIENANHRYTALNVQAEDLTRRNQELEAANESLEAQVGLLNESFEEESNSQVEDLAHNFPPPPPPPPMPTPTPTPNFLEFETDDTTDSAAKPKPINEVLHTALGSETVESLLSEIKAGKELRYKPQDLRLLVWKNKLPEDMLQRISMKPGLLKTYTHHVAVYKTQLDKLQTWRNTSPQDLNLEELQTNVQRLDKGLFAVNLQEHEQEINRLFPDDGAVHNVTNENSNDESSDDSDWEDAEPAQITRDPDAIYGESSADVGMSFVGDPKMWTKARDIEELLNNFEERLRLKHAQLQRSLDFLKETYGNQKISPAQALELNKQKREQEAATRAEARAQEQAAARVEQELRDQIAKAEAEVFLHAQIQALKPFALKGIKQGIYHYKSSTLDGFTEGFDISGCTIDEFVAMKKENTLNATTSAFSTLLKQMSNQADFSNHEAALKKCGLI